MFLCHVQLISLGDLLLYEGDGEGVDLGEKGGWAGTGKRQVREGCLQDTLYERNIKFLKINKYRQAPSQRKRAYKQKHNQD